MPGRRSGPRERREEEFRPEPPPLEPLLYCQGRLLDLVHRLAKAAPDDGERRAAEAIVSRSYASLLELSLSFDPEAGALRAIVEGLGGEDGAGGIIGTAIELVDFVPEEPGRYGLSEQLFFPPAAPLVNPPIVGISLTGPPLPEEPPWWYWELTPENVRRLFERLIEILRQVEQATTDPQTRERIRAMIAALNAYLARLAAGGKIYFHELWRWLTQNFLAAVRPILQGLGRNGVRFAIAIASAIWTWLQSIGLALGAETAGLGAAALGAGFVAACLAALIGGGLVGRWIAQLEYQGKTVEDWIAEGLFLQYFADPQDCEDLYDEYVRARATRVAYETSGPTIDKSIMVPLLAAEVRILRRYLAVPCADSGGSIRRMVAELERRLALLTR